MSGKARPDGGRGMRIGVMLLLFLYGVGYGLLRERHILLRVDGALWDMGGSRPRLRRSAAPFISVDRDHPHLQWLTPIYQPLAHLEFWIRDRLNER